MFCKNLQHPLRFFLKLALLVSLSNSLSAQLRQSGIQLGEPIQLSTEEVERLTSKAPIDLAKKSASAQAGEKSGAAVPLSGFTIDRSNRNAVVAAYHRYYLASEDFETDMNWTGDVANCEAGTIASAFRDKTLRRINYYRAQSGLPADIYFDVTKNDKAQEAALIMAYENSLSHDPADDFPGNPCLSPSGIEAAAAGNLALGSYGPGAVDAYMIDDGSNNSVVGHRRWLLYSRAQEMGSGSIPFNYSNWPISLPEHNAANCIWVIGDFKPAPTPQAAAYPNDGYVPWQLSPDSGESFPRWSYSYPGANFSSASVTMTHGGAPVAVTQESVTTGAGDNTLVWRPGGIPDAAPGGDTTYTVSISGITGVGFTSTSYDVTVIDPYRVNDSPVVSGSATPFANTANSYTFSATDQAEAYEVQVFEVDSATWLEGAESSPTPMVIDNTDAAYSLLSTAYADSGSRAFHLAVANPAEDESFTIDRTIFFETGSEVSFSYRRFWMRPETKLRIEISADNGSNFTLIGSIDGQNSSGSSADWDGSFTDVSFAVPVGLQNTGALLRFRIEATGSYYPLGGGGNPVSFFGLHIDNIEVSNANELVVFDTQTLGGAATGFDFTPTSSGQDYLIQVLPELGGHQFGAGSPLEVSSIEGVPAPDITSASTAEGVQGAVFSYLITATNAPTSYGASGLPAGASIDSGTGEITGTIVPGTYPGITISATNAGGTANAPLTIHVLTGYEHYIEQNALSLGAPGEDDDEDSILNLIEVALDGFDPEVPDAHLLPGIEIVDDTMVMTIQKSGVKGLDYAIIGTDDLSADPWLSSGISILTDDATTLEVSVPMSHADRYFLQLSVTQNSEPTTSN
ncbi:MAG: putative Ig domain-containing protein [Opitutales bacterium]